MNLNLVIYRKAPELIYSLIKKDVLLIALTSNVLGLVFPNDFNKSFIKYKTFVTVECNSRKVTRNDQKLIHPGVLSKFTISKFCQLSYVVIIPNNFKILLSLLGLSYPKI